MAITTVTLNSFALMRSRDKEMAKAFNDPRRSNAFILLANIKEQGLLTEEELMQFSPDGARVSLLDSCRESTQLHILKHPLL